MKTLKEILEASILDKVENTLANGDQQIKNEIIKFLEKNFKFKKGYYTISDNPNEDGKYVVDVSGDVEAANEYTLKELTNEATTDTSEPYLSLKQDVTALCLEFENIYYNIIDIVMKRRLYGDKKNYRS